MLFIWTQWIYGLDLYISYSFVLNAVLSYILFTIAFHVVVFLSVYVFYFYIIMYQLYGPLNLRGF